MSTGEIPDVTPSDAQVLVRLGGELQLVWTTVGGYRVRHVCNRRQDGRGTIICAPLLTQHIIQFVPEAGYTVSPSILCSDCGLHGYLIANEWRAV